MPQSSADSLGRHFTYCCIPIEFTCSLICTRHDSQAYCIPLHTLHLVTVQIQLDLTRTLYPS